jgi:hypothetical protein
VSGDQQGPHRPAHPAADALNELVGVGGRDAQHIGEFLALQAMTGMEVQDLALALGQAGLRLREQFGQVIALCLGAHVRLFGDLFCKLVVEHEPAPGAEAVPDLVAGDGVDPGTQAVWFAQLPDVLRDEQHGVVDDVGGLVCVAEHRPGKVVETVGVGVVEVTEPCRFTRKEPLNELPIVSHPGGA